MVAVLYGFLVDFTSNLLIVLPNVAIWHHITYCILGILSLALGIFVVLKTDFLMLPPDAMIKLIAQKLKTEYSKIKIITDSTLTAIAIISSLVIYESLVHVGIGTIAAAIFIGFTIKKLKNVKPLNRFIERGVEIKDVV